MNNVRVGRVIKLTFYTCLRKHSIVTQMKQINWTSAQHSDGNRSGTVPDLCIRGTVQLGSRYPHIDPQRCAQLPGHCQRIAPSRLKSHSLHFLFSKQTH